ncbi:ANK [Mytilus coruscus]|uniref:ANK n=1 Tax=Mytilus coruscus TaxID=42192 RepID=A0A6J8EMG4_MYTCO|nr:ANK [Mytilus coruscus]
MTASKHLISKEVENYLKLMLLSCTTSQSAIRWIFDKEFCPETLQTTIIEHWGKLCKLMNKGVISKIQLETLKPPKGLELRSSNLDMTLMICLLRNLTDMNFDAPQSQVNYNISYSNETAISTIKFYRNKLHHIDDCSSVSDIAFNEMFDAVTTAIIKLNPALGKDCELIRHGPLNFEKNVGILTALHDMCHDGNYELAKSLILQGLPVNGVNYLGLTPLHVASHEGHTNIVELLLSHGAKAVVNHGTFSGSRPLHFASHENHIDIVEILLANGANVNDSNKNGSTPLHLASYNNLTEIAELLIKKGADINRGKVDKRTPLHVACRVGNPEIVSLLCRYKALVDQLDKHGRTPLSYAEENGNREIILILQTINHPGSDDQNLRNAYLTFSIPIFINSRLDILKSSICILVNSSVGLILQSSNFDITLMKCLLRIGTAISTIKFYRNKIAHILNCSVSDIVFNEMFDAVTKAVIKLNPALSGECESIRHGSFDKQLGNFTAMHNMCHDGNFELAKLIQQGLPVNEENYLRLTPLHLASHEAVVNKGNISGSTPLHFASHECHKEIVEFLLQHGADKHQGNYNQSKPIHLATHENHIDIVKFLFENGANVNDINKNGSTPLHLASYSNLTEMAKFLIKNGADINRAKLDKRTPLHVACRAGNPEIVCLLVGNKALIDQTDNDGRTPLFYVKDNGNREKISILHPISHPGNEDQNVVYVFMFLLFVIIICSVLMYIYVI